MQTLILTLVILLILSEGTGQWVLKYLKIQTEGFAAPVGTAFLFTLLELLYFPAMLAHLSTDWVRITTVLVLILAVLFTLVRWKETFHALFRARTIYIILALGLFLFLLKGHDSLLLQDEGIGIMSANMNTSSIDLQSMPLQGYLLYGGVTMARLGRHTGLGAIELSLFAEAVGVMLALDIIDSFQIMNPWFRFTLIVFAVFYCGFAEWRILGACTSDSWRLIFIALSIYCLYRWLAEGKENIKYLLLIAFGAGFFVSRGFFMVSFEILYCLMVYLFHIKKIRGLYDITTLAGPVIVYLCGWMSRFSIAGAVITAAIYVLFLINRWRRRFYHRIIQVENFFIDHNRRIFFITVPVVFLVGTFILRFFVPGYGIEYSFYINYFALHEVNGFLFPSGNFIDIVIDCVRWAGLLVFLKNGNGREDGMVKYLFLGMLVFFVNPLCMGMLTEITGLDMYACAFEILFNPFTDILVLIAIYKLFEWTVVGQWVLELILVFAALFGHITSWAGMRMGLYTDLVHGDPPTEEVQEAESE
jgi:hypothetical protein